MKDILKQLMQLTQEKKYDEIKGLLDGCQFKDKGKLFEQYLTELLNGCGLFARRTGKPGDKGGDILLLDKKDPEFVIKVIQAKNQKRPMCVDDLAYEIEKFRNKGLFEYKCKFFSVYSVNGYTEKCQGYEEFNTELNNWNDIKKLVDGYKKNQDQHDIILLPHNQATFKKIQMLWESTNKVCSIQATGTGKTYLIIKAILETQGKKVVLAPLEKIHEQIQFKGAYQDSNVDYYTYNLLSYKTENEIKNMQYDLIVLDEFHRAGGGAEKWGQAVNILLNANPNAKVLGTTATPIRSEGIDMAEHIFQNKVAAKISLPEAIVREILPEPRYVVALYEIDEVVKRLDEKIKMFDENEKIKSKYKREIETFKVSWENSRGMSNVFKKHIKAERKFIVFCKNNEHLKQMKWKVAEWFEKAKIVHDVKIYVSTSHNKKEGEEHIRQFEKDVDENTIKLLFTINKFNEGLHIRSVDGVILLRSTSSHRVYLQQMGRAFESGSQKKPIIFDLVNNFEMLKEINFVEKIRAAEIKHNTKRKRLKLKSKQAQFIFEDETKSILDFKKEFDQRIEDPWYWMYESLVMYKEENGNVITSLMDKNSSNLKNWCENQRYLETLLVIKKKELLSSIGFLFNAEEDSWLGVYHHAKEIYKKYGSIKIHHPSEELLDPKLKDWLIGQRKLYESKQLGKKEVDLLNKLNFNLIEDEDESWYINYKLIKNFYNEEINSGLLEIDNSFNEADVNWLIEQREKHLNGELSLEKIKLLKEINFGVDREVTSFINNVQLFIKSPNSVKYWGDQIYNLYKENQLKDWQEKILNKFKLNELLNQLYSKEIEKVKETTVEIDHNTSNSKLTEEIERFEKKAITFMQSPNSLKNWGDEVYNLYKENQLEEWQKEILQRWKVHELLEKVISQEVKNWEKTVLKEPINNEKSTELHHEKLKSKKRKSNELADRKYLLKDNIISLEKNKITKTKMHTLIFLYLKKLLKLSS